ncbi:MAG: HAD family hydrolase [Promethearchaeota archaeon]
MFDVILFDFDGVIMTHATAEFTAKKALEKPFFRWTPLARKELTPAKIVRIFELNDATRNKDFIKNIYLEFAPYISSRRRRFWFFMYMGRKIRINESKVVSVIPGVPELLSEVHNAGIRTGIVSSSQYRRIHKLLDKFDLSPNVDVLVTRDQIKKYGLKLKPAPDPIIFALVQLKRQTGMRVDRSRVLFVGDLPSDVLTGKRAGVRTAAVLSGHGYLEELEALAPDYIVDSAPDLVDKIKNLLDR